LSNFRWPPAAAALAIATVGYFFLARFLQDRVLPVDRSVVAHKLSTFQILPEPYELPLYLLSYLIIPISAAALFPLLAWAGPKLAAARPLVRRRAVALSLAAAALASAGWVIAAFVVPALRAYLQRRGIGDGLWLLFTKRLFAVRLALGFGVAVFCALAWRWRNASFAWLRPHLNPAWAVRLEPWLPLVLAVVLFDPTFPHEERHYNHVVGTVNDVLAGKPLFYETANQYGILNLYLLVMLFRWLVPLTYQTFSAVLAVCYFLFFSGVYLWLRRWLSSRLLALVGTTTAVATYFLLQGGPYLSPYSYPGTTPYRQGWYVAVAAAVLWVNRRPHLQWWRRDLPLQLSALAVLWNLDAGLAIAAAACLALAAGYLLRPGTSLRQRVRAAVGLAVRQAAYLVIAFGAVVVANFAVFNAWPNWSLYRDAMGVYGTGLAKLPLPVIGIFELYVLTYLVAGAVILRRWVRGAAPDMTFIFLFGYGVLSLTYYIGNSAWNYLYPVTVPMVLVLLYLFATTYLQPGSRGSHEAVAARAFVAMLAVVVALLALKLPVEFSKRDYHGVGNRLTLEASATAPELLKDARRMAVEFPAGERPPLAHAHDGQLLLLSRRTNWFPLFDQIDIVFDWQLQRLVDQVARERPERILVGDEDFPYRPYFVAGIAPWYQPAERWGTLTVYRRKSGSAGARS